MTANIKLPNKIMVLGKPITVLRAPLKNAHGEFDRTNFTITLDTDCPAHLIEDTMMHETMHAVLWISGVSQLLSDQLEEAICFASESMTNVYKARK